MSYDPDRYPLLDQLWDFIYNHPFTCLAILLLIIEPIVYVLLSRLS